MRLGTLKAINCLSNNDVLTKTRKRFMNLIKSCSRLGLVLLPLALNQAQAAVLPEAETVTKITLVKKPSSKPMSIAYVPFFQRYYVADGGLAPTPGDNEAPVSKSQSDCAPSHG